MYLLDFLFVCLSYVWLHINLNWCLGFFPLLRTLPPSVLDALKRRQLLGFIAVSFRQNNLDFSFEQFNLAYKHYFSLCIYLLYKGIFDR